MPKASRMILKFDPLSHLETGDFLRISEKLAVGDRTLWRAGRHDVARSGWPGVDAPALVVNGDTFQVTVERLMKPISDERSTAFGYRIIAEAELPPDAVPSMQKLVPASTFICASILSEVGLASLHSFASHSEDFLSP